MNNHKQKSEIKKKDDLLISIDTPLENSDDSLVEQLAELLVTIYLEDISRFKKQNN